MNPEFGDQFFLILANGKFIIAGINIVKGILEFTREDWDRLLETNLLASYFFCQAVCPHMIEKRKGSIINHSSICASIAMSGRGPYSVTKAGITQLTKNLALELADYNIRVNALCPGVAKTALVEHFIESNPNPEDIRKFFESMNPLPGLISIECIAASALFLVSDDAAFITGVALPIDGGSTAGRNLF